MVSCMAFRCGELSNLYREVISMTEVFLGDQDNFEVALRKFKKKVQQDGLASEIRKRKYYEKPCERRKRKEAASKRRVLRRRRRAYSSF
jgi:small subunit ribosomal protein S21